MDKCSSTDFKYKLKLAELTLLLNSSGLSREHRRQIKKEINILSFELKKLKSK